MGYFNWGEQIGNSFMNMYAQNQQKRLEDARTKMEQERIDMDRQKMESQLQTDALTRQYQTMQMKEIMDENAAYASIPGQWLDANGNKVQDAGEMINAKYFDKVKDFGYSNLNVPVVDQNTGRISTNEQYLPMYRQESVWNQGNALATLSQTQFNSAADRNLRQQEISNSGTNNSLLRQQNNMIMRQTLQTALSNSIPELNQYGYSDANMNFVPYKGQKGNYEKFLNRTMGEFNGVVDRAGLEDYINSAMHNAARGAKTTPAGSTTKYTLAKDAASSGTKLPAGSMKVLNSPTLRKFPNIKVDSNGWAYVEQNGKKIWVVDANNNLVKGALLKTGSK